MSKVFEAGYHLEVTSWENDADAYATTKEYFATKEELDLAVKFYSLFESRNGRNGGLGNSTTNTAKVYDFVKERCPEILEAFITDAKVDEDCVAEQLWEMAYNTVGVWNDGRYWRVVEHMSAYHVPETVTFLEIKI